jgi:hypothetical protein
MFITFQNKVTSAPVFQPFWLLGQPTFGISARRFIPHSSVWVEIWRSRERHFRGAAENSRKVVGVRDRFFWGWKWLKICGFAIRMLPMNASLHDQIYTILIFTRRSKGSPKFPLDYPILPYPGSGLHLFSFSTGVWSLWGNSPHFVLPHVTPLRYTSRTVAETEEHKSQW